MAINTEKVPYHLAIIMDGNGRWARAQGLPRMAGHRAGTENLRVIIRACVEFGIKILTIYAFSTENWGRPQAEVSGLLTILSSVIDRELDELNENGVRLQHIGKLEGINRTLKRKVRQAIERTRDNDTLTLNVAFNYGGRDEIMDATRQMLRDGIAPDDVDEALFSQYLYTGNQPDPDLIVRTSGEFRTSNFLIWQGAYSEYYVTSTFWPDFDRAQLELALNNFAQRDRRFGVLK